MPLRENLELELGDGDAFATPPEEPEIPAAESDADEPETAADEPEAAADEAEAEAAADEPEPAVQKQQLEPNRYAQIYLDIDERDGGRIVRLPLYKGAVKRESLTPPQRTEFMVIVQSLIVYLQQLLDSDSDDYRYGGPGFFSLNTALTYYLRELDFLQSIEQGTTTSVSSFRPIYYYLGYVVQALVYSLGFELNKDGEVYKTEYPLKVKWNVLRKEIPFVFNPKLSRLEGINDFDIRNNSQLVKSTFEIPVSMEEVDALLTSPTTSNLSIIDIIQEILSLVKNQIEFAEVSLGIRFLPNDPSVMEIFEMADKDAIDSVYADIFDAQDNFQEDSFNKSFIINYGEKSSLVENINVTAKVDPNVLNSFRLPLNIGTLNVDLFSVIRNKPSILSAFSSIISSPIYKNAVNSGSLDPELSVPYEAGSALVERINVDEENFNDLFQRYSEYLELGVLNESKKNDFNKFLGDVAYLSYDLQQFLINTAASENSNFASTLLQTFLLKVDTTIHGTAGLGSFDHAVIRNYLPGTTGLYTITSIEDILSDKGFSTLLQMNLVRAIGVED